MITIDRWDYEILIDYREAFKEEAFQDRYSEILNKYDYILGDWGYGQLRLKGFFDDKNQKATYDTKVSTLQDYLYEYCNFGCAYFILKKTGPAKPVAVPAAIEEVVKEEIPQEENLDSDVQSS
ncbi:YutD family protein [Paenisporosarcina quisquiliarum]|uniref:YutD family protein n=1 Tax=Paenisporosarcina quisquiliarum TaxID=365346 RepID=A0A9X3LHB9_9BACL|nr:YutD family protein [Paenisporosarcina quisquiliarum]MCZ8537415.1 YutD family protein [Paenisporosarcina quisquiliarum]